jgi:hypothetical protein
MQLLQVIPKVFYEDIRHGLALFIDTLGFEISWHEPDPPFYVIKEFALLDETTVCVIIQQTV